VILWFTEIAAHQNTLGAGCEVSSFFFDSSQETPQYLKASCTSFHPPLSAWRNYNSRRNIVPAFGGAGTNAFF
jgi:hypothetical protein